jgi:hypothetical protein
VTGLIAGWRDVESEFYLVAFNESGEVIEFEVMIRLSGRFRRLRDEMGTGSTLN